MEFKFKSAHRPSLGEVSFPSVSDTAPGPSNGDSPGVVDRGGLIAGARVPKCRTEAAAPVVSWGAARPKSKIDPLLLQYELADKNRGTKASPSGLARRGSLGSNAPLTPRGGASNGKAATPGGSSRGVAAPPSTNFRQRSKSMSVASLTTQVRWGCLPLPDPRGPIGECSRA